MAVNERDLRTGAKPAARRRAPNGKVDVQADQIRALDPGHKDIIDNHVFICGRPSMQGYISYIRGETLDPPDERVLAEQWTRGAREYERRQRTEAGIADDIQIAPLPREFRALEKQLRNDPVFQNGYDSVRTEIGIVELDRMVIYQRHIDLAFVETLKRRFGREPDAEQIFRACLLSDYPTPPVTWKRTASDTFVFLSPSNDLRYLGTMELEEEHITGYPLPGAVVGIVGLCVGFGSNFLNAIHVNGRLVLHNGSHRAYALRALGITHVPCIVQYCSSLEELNLVTDAELQRNPDRYLKPKRPPMLRDYFDPKLHKVLRCVRRLKQVRIKFSRDETEIPAVSSDGP